MMPKTEKLLKPWQMGTHLRVLNESYPTYTNLGGFPNELHPCALDESSLSIGRVENNISGDVIPAYLLPPDWSRDFSLPFRQL